MHMASENHDHELYHDNYKKKTNKYQVFILQQTILRRNGLGKKCTPLFFANVNKSMEFIF